MEKAKTNKLEILFFWMVEVLLFFFVAYFYRGNFFQEVLLILTVCLIAAGMIISFIDEEHRIWTELNIYFKNICKVKHDLGERIMLANFLLEEGNTMAAEEIISQLNLEYQTIGSHTICSDPILNGILTRWDHECKENHILLELQIELKEKICILPTDLCKIISNLMKNAKRAVESYEGFQKITLSVSTNQKRVEVICKNGKSRNTNHCNYESEEKGFGKQIVRETVRKYNGTVSFREEKDEYEVSLILDNQDIS